MTFKKGDKVTHACSSPRGEMYAEFSHYIDNASHNFSEARVAVIYTAPGKEGKEGDWLEKYCKHREPVKPETPEQQNKPKPQEDDFPQNSSGSPVLQYFQVLYAWRGYNGLGRAYEAGKYYEWEKKRRTSHITDPVANGPMEILTNLQKQVRDNMANASPTLRNKTRFEDEVYHPGTFGIGYDKAEMFKNMYMNGHPDAIRGTELHKVLFDEVDWDSIPKFDDAQDAARYMSIDWANDFNPKTNPENTVKATIKEIYVDGVLTQTLINDINLDAMESSDLLHQIGNVEAAIQKLTKHNGAKSKFIGQEMKRLTNFVESVYLLLDQKFYKTPENVPVDKSV